jgi:hypothetical protein
LPIEIERIKYNNIQEFGERYCKSRRYLARWNKKTLQDDWWEALKFFFDHSFSRRRRGELSQKYYNFTIKTLEGYFQIPKEKTKPIAKELDRAYENLKEKKAFFSEKVIMNFKRDKNIARGNSQKRKDFIRENAEKNKIVGRLVDINKETSKEKEELALGNEADVLMVLGCLNFISEDNRKNVYNYLRDKITNSGVEETYNELNGIWGIGAKIASFIIRDIMLINSVKFKDVKDPYNMAFPVDTWVRKIAIDLMQADRANENIKDKEIEEIKEYLIQKCKDFEIDPLKFAAGLWYLGVNSLDLLLEKIGEVNFKPK